MHVPDGAERDAIAAAHAEVWAGLQQLVEVHALQRQGAIEPPDLLYLTRRAMQPQRDAVLPRSILRLC